MAFASMKAARVGRLHTVPVDVVFVWLGCLAQFPFQAPVHQESEAKCGWRPHSCPVLFFLAPGFLCLRHYRRPGNFLHAGECAAAVSCLAVYPAGRKLKIADRVLSTNMGQRAPKRSGGAVTADAPPSTRGPCAGPRLSGRVVSGTALSLKPLAFQTISTLELIPTAFNSDRHGPISAFRLM